METTSNASNAVLEVPWRNDLNQFNNFRPARPSGCPLSEAGTKGCCFMGAAVQDVKNREGDLEEQAWRTVADGISGLQDFCAIECSYSFWSNLALLLKLERYKPDNQRPHSTAVGQIVTDNGSIQDVCDALTKYAGERNGISHLGRQKTPQQLLQFAQRITT